MSSYQEIWEECNDLCNKGPKKHRIRLIELCIEMQQTLRGDYKEPWIRREQLLREGRYNKIWDDS